MPATAVPVQVNKVWEKRHTRKDYSGTSDTYYIPTIEVVILTEHEKRELKLDDYPWLKNRYEHVEDEVIGERVAAVLDDTGGIVIFGESKEELNSFEAEEL